MKNSLWTARVWLLTNIGVILAWIIFFPDHKDTLISLLTFLAGLNIVVLGILVPFIHWQYFKNEKNRAIELDCKKMVIKYNNKLPIEIKTDEIMNILLFNRIRVDNTNFRLTCIDSYYYLVFSLKNGQNVAITCLMDIHLKKTIEEWSGMKLKHEYQFFPFIKKQFLKDAIS